MDRQTGKGCTDTASRVIAADPQAIYAAFIDPKAWLAWLPPKGMTGEIHAFEARPGGAYRMTLHYDAQGHGTPGKSSDHADTVAGRFVELVPGERIVQAAAFEADDPAFAGEMVITWRLTPKPEGTQVTITCENVPAGISKADHDAGLRSTLENLAAFVE